MNLAAANIGIISELLIDCMGVARILERVGRTRHVIRVTSQWSQLVRPHIRRNMHAWSQAGDDNHDPEVQRHYRQDPLDILARLRHHWFPRCSAGKGR